MQFLLVSPYSFFTVSYFPSTGSYFPCAHPLSSLCSDFPFYFLLFLSTVLGFYSFSLPLSLSCHLPKNPDRQIDSNDTFLLSTFISLILSHVLSLSPAISFPASLLPIPYIQSVILSFLSFSFFPLRPQRSFPFLPLFFRSVHFFFLTFIIAYFSFPSYFCSSLSFILFHLYSCIIFFPFLV